MEPENFGNLQRTRRNLLAAGGLLAGAALSQLGTSKAKAKPEHEHHACFLPGTLLKTPHAECKVEDLRIGDLVTTLSGEAKPITWIGRRVYKRSTSGRHPESIFPVRVTRGALGPNVPHLMLRLSLCLARSKL